MELHKRRSIELAQLCQDQKRKEFEKQNELTEVQKLIRGKNDQLEEWKIRVKQCSDKQKKLKVSFTIVSPFLSILLCFYTPISVGTTPFFQKKFIHLYIEKVYITYLIQNDIFGHDFRFFIG